LQRRQGKQEARWQRAWATAQQLVSKDGGDGECAARWRDHGGAVLAGGTGSRLGAAGSWVAGSERKKARA
jgi:hypothetical protein